MQNGHRFIRALAAVALLFGLFLANCSNDNDMDLLPNVSSDSEPSSSSDLELSSSSNLEPSSSSSSQRDTYLGYGYDVINSSYINRGDVKIMHPILDQKRMADDGLISFGQIGGMQKFETFAGNSLTKFYEERNENIGLGLDASVTFKGVLFSGKYETEFGVKLNESRIDENAYLRGRSYHYTHHEYIGNGRATAEKLAEYLGEGFAADLRSKTAAQILDRYGSHVFVQYYKGGAMEYNYAYFGTELTKNAELSNALKISLSANSKLLGASVGISSSLKEEEKRLQEELENNSIFHSYTYGGELVNASSVKLIESNYTAWLNSINSRPDICGIGKFDESFIPVWELAAASGETELAKGLENEFLDRAARQGKNMQTMKTTAITKEFATAGDAIYTFDKGFPATIEIYALGAGGGGQGGHTKDRGMQWLGPDGEYSGTGGAGGGGAATYIQFEVTERIDFNITIGKGGIGGGGIYSSYTADWQSGTPGGKGGNTSVSWRSNTLAAEGGYGGGGAGNITTGGSGGRANTTWPAITYFDKDAVAGKSGYDGNGIDDKSGDIKSTGGSAASTSKGSIVPFGGGSGALRHTGSSLGTAGSGGGGSGGYSRDQSGSNGGDGKVIIVVKYKEIPQ